MTSPYPKMKPMHARRLAQLIRLICNTWLQYHYIKLQDIEATRDKQAYLQSLDQKEQ